MREIRTEDAVGHILCHDITQIIKDEKKGVLFKKGHVVKENRKVSFTKMRRHRFYMISVPGIICMAQK